MDERRRFIRSPLWLNVKYQIVKSEAARYSVTRNTSSGGIGLFTESRLPPGTIVEVAVEFPDQKRTISFTAEVTWSGKLLLERGDQNPRAYETGVRFVKISEADRAFLMKHASS